MSPISSSSRCALLCATSTNSCWSSLSFVSRSKSSIPITPVIGVRISWLMFETKSVFSFAERSAVSRASISASCDRWRSNMREQLCAKARIAAISSGSHVRVCRIS